MVFNFVLKPTDFFFFFNGLKQLKYYVIQGWKKQQFSK